MGIYCSNDCDIHGKQLVINYCHYFMLMILQIDLLLLSALMYKIYKSRTTKHKLNNELDDEDQNKPM